MRENRFIFYIKIFLRDTRSNQLSVCHLLHFLKHVSAKREEESRIFTRGDHKQRSGANLRSVGVHFSLRSVWAASEKIIKEFVKRTRCCGRELHFHLGARNSRSGISTSRKVEGVSLEEGVPRIYSPRSHPLVKARRLNSPGR